jgi:hypothetical protein
MLGEDERDVTDEEIAALEAEHGLFLPADGEEGAPVSCGAATHPVLAGSEITFDFYNADVITLP